MDATTASTSSGTGVRLAELMGALSLATDIAMGQADEDGLATCLVASGFAAQLGLDEEQRGHVYYLALLRHVGCTAGSHEFAALIGDELAFRSGAATLDFGSPSEMFVYLVRHLRGHLPPARTAAAIFRFLATGPRLMREGSRSICEAGALLATRFGFDRELATGVAQFGERWDGKGFPGETGGAAVSLPARVVQIAEAAHVFAGIGGAPLVASVLRDRAGKAYDPELAERFATSAEELLAVRETPSRWDAVLAAEPGPTSRVAADDLDRALRAMGDFADLKSPYTVGHSSGVAALAEEAGRRAGLTEADCVALRRAGFVHDLGRVGVSAAIWGTEGPLSEAQWEAVRLHPYHGERVLTRSPELRPLATLGSLHHERCDGSGYHRSVGSQAISPAARVLAAADVFHALREPRPHREALEPEQAAAVLRDEVRSGRLDGDAAEAVLAAAGQGRLRRRTQVAGLTPRELEVLRLVARGHSNREIARALTIAPKTADAHLQHIYAKIGVKTRAGATLFAAQNDLLEPAPR